MWLGAHFGVAADAVVLALEAQLGEGHKAGDVEMLRCLGLRSVISSQDAFSMPSPLFMWEEPVPVWCCFFLEGRHGNGVRGNGRNAGIVVGPMK